MNYWFEIITVELSLLLLKLLVSKDMHISKIYRIEINIDDVASDNG